MGITMGNVGSHGLQSHSDLHVGMCLCAHVSCVHFVCGCLYVFVRVYVCVYNAYVCLCVYIVCVCVCVCVCQ